MKMVRRRPTRRMQGDNERGFLRKRAQEALRAAERAVAIRERLTKQNPVPLLSLPVSYRALHQHRAGACLGNLTVTAEAVDYRSDDGKDVFHIPIRDIRSVARGMGSLLNHAGRSTADGTGCRLETAQTAWPFDSELRRHDQRLKFCRGRGVAKVALARKLAVRLYGRRREAVAPRPPARESCGVS